MAKHDRPRPLTYNNLAHRKILMGLIWERDGGCCWLCGGRINPFDPDTNRRASLDHVVPRSRGGNGHIGNLKLAHKGCNANRGSKAPPAGSGTERKE